MLLFVSLSFVSDAGNFFLIFNKKISFAESSCINKGQLITGAFILKYRKIKFKFQINILFSEN